MITSSMVELRAKIQRTGYVGGARWWGDKNYKCLICASRLEDLFGDKFDPEDELVVTLSKRPVRGSMRIFLRITLICSSGAVAWYSRDRRAWVRLSMDASNILADWIGTGTHRVYLKVGPTEKKETTCRTSR